MVRYFFFSDSITNTGCTEGSSVYAIYAVRPSFDTIDSLLGCIRCATSDEARYTVPVQKSSRLSERTTARD